MTLNGNASDCKCRIETGCTFARNFRNDGSSMSLTLICAECATLRSQRTRRCEIGSEIVSRDDRDSCASRDHREREHRAFFGGDDARLRSRNPFAGLWLVDSWPKRAEGPGVPGVEIDRLVGIYRPRDRTCPFLGTLAGERWCCYCCCFLCRRQICFGLAVAGTLLAHSLASVALLARAGGTMELEYPEGHVVVETVASLVIRAAFVYERLWFFRGQSVATCLRCPCQRPYRRGGEASFRDRCLAIYRDGDPFVWNF